MTEPESKSLAIHIRVPEATVELRHALRLLQLPAGTSLAENGPFAATVTLGARPTEASLPEVSLPQSEEGFAVVHGTGDCLHMVSGSAHGLANCLYELRHKLLMSRDRALGTRELLPEGEHAPRFRQRDFYHFLSPWRLQHLSCDSFTLEEWKTHLERMRALNANRMYFDIWSNQYFHPDCAETAHNQALYDRLKAVCDYAHELGLRTGVYLFPAQVPVSVYLSHPGARAAEAANYHGINACPSNGWEHIVKFDAFLLQYFGSSLNDVVVEMQDPGSCLCRDCCRSFPEIILRFIDTYREVSADCPDRRIDLCTLHFRDWLEEPAGDTGVAFPIKRLRKTVFSRLAPGTTLIDIDEATLNLGRQMGLNANYFFFDLDPESGLENRQVFPRVKLSRIEQQLRDSCEQGHDGITAYRMMPLVQFPADYVLFRKCWDPNLELGTALEELAGEYGLAVEDRAGFKQAMLGLDAWWEQADLDALKSVHAALQALRSSCQNRHFICLCDLIAVLHPLARYLMENRSRVNEPDFYPPEDLVRATRNRMIGTHIFEAYTVNQHWVLRSTEVIGQRIRWWLQGIAREVGLTGSVS